MKTYLFWGALLSLTCAATYVAGFILLVTSLTEIGYIDPGADPRRIINFYTENIGLMQVWNLTIYVVNGLALAGLASVLAQYFQEPTPVLSKMILGIGLLWSTLVVGAGMVANVGVSVIVEIADTDTKAAAELWRVINTVETGLGGGNEIAGAIWALLIAVAILRSKAMSDGLAGFSFALTVSGCLTLFPMCAEIAGAIFGLGYILWFCWIALTLQRVHAGTPQPLLCIES